MIYVELDHSKIPVEYFERYPHIKQTLSLIKICHNGQSYNNLPYWHHPVRVMLRLNWYKTPSSVIYAALMHDVIEDTPATRGDLWNFGYSERTLELVEAVTRNKDEENYKMFIQRIIATGDHQIMRLKLADLYENSNNVRFLPPEKRSIMVRYGKSIQDILGAMQGEEAQLLAANTVSGELNKADVEKWIGEQPTFL